MSIVLVGAGGQVGRAIQEAALAQHIPLQAYSHAQCDITDDKALAKFFETTRPNVLINAAAYTAVDLAETHRDEAFRLNAKAPEALAKFCKQYDCLLVHLSTDYVFDGLKPTAYVETDWPHPSNVYGTSKMLGEQAIQLFCDKYLILRVSWVFGVHGNNFVKTMLRLAQTRETLNVVADQYGCPTSAQSIAHVIFHCIEKIQADFSLCGLYHYCDADATTWYDFAQAIIEGGREKFGLHVKTINPLTTAEYPTPAPRPQNSVLDTSKIEEIFHTPRFRWREQLTEVLEELTVKLNNR